VSGSSIVGPPSIMIRQQLVHTYIYIASDGRSLQEASEVNGVGVIRTANNNAS
jgi:hypothetical protein